MLGHEILFLFFLTLTSKSSWAHVGLTFPPARQYDLDFLDNVRTRPPCGMPKGKANHLKLLKCLLSTQFAIPRGHTNHPSLNTQSCIRRLLCSTLKFENLHSSKKTILSPQKIQKNSNFFFIKDILCNFLVQMLEGFQEKNLPLKT